MMLSQILILQIITQQELQKLIQILLKRWIFKEINFPVKISEIQKMENTNSIAISVFGYENKEKYPIYVSKTCCEEKHVDNMFLSVISIDSCIIIYYIAKEKIFVVIVYMLSLQEKY